MNTKYEIGQRVSFPVRETRTANIDSIQICKGGKVLYSVGGKMVDESVLTAEPAFNWVKFKAGGVAVHCDTEEKAEAFLRECKSHGMRWNDGGNLSDDTWWDSYGPDTCYDAEGRLIAYAPASFFKKSKYTVVECPFRGEAEAEA